MKDGVLLADVESGVQLPAAFDIAKYGLRRHEQGRHLFRSEADRIGDPRPYAPRFDSVGWSKDLIAFDEPSVRRSESQPAIGEPLRDDGVTSAK